MGGELWRVGCLDPEGTRRSSGIAEPGRGRLLATSRGDSRAGDDIWRAWRIVTRDRSSEVSPTVKSSCERPKEKKEVLTFIGLGAPFQLRQQWGWLRIFLWCV
eukprot:c29498_g1_i1.p2 GENE.c29498_g1_i1~~c29498_g1_i1.p2  ORF type:complete len:103 (+),score=0.83 c29498_g1_i1:1-309(+)